MSGGKKEASCCLGKTGCVYMCVCVHAIKRVTIAELCSRTSWSSIRRAPSEQMSNVQEKARSSSAPMVQH